MQRCLLVFSPLFAAVRHITRGFGLAALLCFCVSRALFSFLKILQNFLDSPSHQIFRRMHGVLNIDENKN